MKADFSDILPKEQISTSADDLKTYGQDWNQILKASPRCILFPKNTNEVSKILKHCNETGIAVVPSGGRTGLSGGAVAANGEVVLSLEKMNRIEKPDSVTRTLRVQSGAITQAVHEVCRPFGLTWPVDFASKGSSQVGGNLSTNAGGINVIHYGNTRNWVLSIEIVLMGGEILELNGDLEKNNTGYDLRHLVMGAEGTLGVITAATLKLAPAIQNKALFLLAVQDMHSAAKVFESCRGENFSLSAFEYLSQKSFRESLAFCGLSSPVNIEKAQGIVLIEIIEPDQNTLDRCFEKIFNEIVLDGVQCQSKTQNEEIWKLRESVAEAVMNGGQVHQHDISVPVQKLVDFAQKIENFYSSQYSQFEVFIFGHIGDGNLHIFIRRPKSLKLEDFLTQAKASDTKLFQLVKDFKGSVSAEHGIGILKRAALPYSRSPRELEIFRGIKKAFDPKGLLNPGKIFE